MDPQRLLGRRLARHIPSRSREYAAAQALVRSGDLVRLLPGVFVRADQVTQGRTRAAAICAYDARAVLTGRAATALHVRHDLWPLVLGLTSPRRWTSAPEWARPRRGTIPGELVRRWPFPHAVPALAVLQAAEESGRPDIIDDALRQGRVTPDSLASAARAVAGTRGGALRRQLVADSVRRPWSSGERELHRVLHRARIAGWQGNVRVLACGSRYVVDILFDDLPVVVELDGQTSHGAVEFEAERARHNDLVAEGWRVLRVTPSMVREQPGTVVDRVRRVLAIARD